MKDLFKFSDTKNVNVQVNIDLKINTERGPILDFSTSNFILNAYALDANGTQVPLAKAGEIPALDLPIFLDGPSLKFDAQLRMPVQVQPRTDGYAIRFELKEALTTSLLLGTDIPPLSALRGDVRRGTAADTNQVNLSIYSTKIIVDSIVDPGAPKALQAYDQIVNLLKDIADEVETQIVAGRTLSPGTFSRSIRSGILFKLISDSPKQKAIYDSILETVAPQESGDARDLFISRFAEGVSSSINDMVSTVSSYLGESNSDEYGTYPSQSLL